MVLSMIINLMQFMTLIFYSYKYMEQNIKRIIALSLNWKINFKLFSLEMGHNDSMYLQ